MQCGIEATAFQNDKRSKMSDWRTGTATPGPVHMRKYVFLEHGLPPRGMLLRA